ncbi:sensor domain-containing diguanylate cyclase [Ancylobacter oerskovii]|uniref:diguanylate cyclase n=1 Tax=Ancylobacter oerskovii TaxID=459519 RepID=A0ABW4Z3K9_9HYPH|nr:GGDEF domain-containing protein [Ancylobacter oerskovii]MBS7546098.1 GGDEF domain-containing protein [Ancylobacter oerskovii]
MFYDPLTIWSFTTFSTLLIAGVLLLSWVMWPGENALAYWGTAFVLTTMGLAGLAARGVVPAFASIELANTALLLAWATAWNGFRAFDRRRPVIWLPLALIGAWILSCQLPGFRDDAVPRMWVMLVFTTVLVLLSIREIYRRRADGLVSRWLVIGLLALHLGAMVARPALLLVGFITVNIEGSVLRDPGLIVYAFELVAFQLLMAFCLIGLVRERRERHFEEAALVDDLTGLLNRRGFQSRIREVVAGGGPMAVLALDLDRFKSINDVYGHAAGDDVLRLFADVLRDNLRGADIVARLGGEEFGIVLPGAGEAAAREIAERIRLGFRRSGEGLPMHEARPSASIGVAAGFLPPLAPEAALAALQEQADAALYAAKRGGRDRVVVHGVGEGAAERPDPGLKAAAP